LQPLFPFLVPLAQQRGISWFGRGREIPAQISDPLTEEYLKRKPKAPKGFVRGDLAPSSIFEDEEIAGPKPATPKGDPVTTISRDPAVMAAVLDPDPRARRRWERKMVIRTIQKRGRLSRAQLIKRQEREHWSKSHNIKTSLKKLGPLARQITGKTVEDAIIQMRFSKKKAALEVRKHLEHARNEAIVSRGIGLGSVEGKEIDRVIIKTKDGKRIKVDDPTTIYVAQAWVGKGDYKIEPDYRARGQTNYMRKPTTRKPQLAQSCQVIPLN
jgi:ribosomal protein L22